MPDRSCLPDVITHTYDPARGPFRNLCDLAAADAERILDDIRTTTGTRLKANYWPRRLEAERWLLAERTRKIGVPRLTHPIYFFLGDMADGRDPARPASFSMPLAAFPDDVITFTYPDSMATLPLATLDAHARHRNDHHGKLFTLPEFRNVVAAFGMPGERWKCDETMTYDRIVEVQVWDERPIRYYLDRSRSPITGPW